MITGFGGFDPPACADCFNSPNAANETVSAKIPSKDMQVIADMNTSRRWMRETHSHQAVRRVIWRQIASRR